MRTIGSVIYRRNGGSGFGISYSEAMAMSWDEIVFWAELLEENREAEVAAMRRANA